MMRLAVVEYTGDHSAPHVGHGVYSSERDARQAAARVLGVATLRGLRRYPMEGGGTAYDYPGSPADEDAPCVMILHADSVAWVDSGRAIIL